MIETQSAVIAAGERRAVQPARSAGGGRLEAQSRAWPGARIAVHAELAAVEALWRGFEDEASCTVFQRFDYLACWFRHLGTRARATPAVVVLQNREGVQAILPLAVTRGRLLRRLTWLGQELCDYAGPLCTPAFADMAPGRFRALWREIGALMQADPRFRHDWVELRRMPAQLDGGGNPFLALPLLLHASYGHVAHLSADWDRFYRSRRPARARKQDRSKLARLMEYGDVALYSPRRPEDIAHVLETLFAQRAETLHRKGIADMFEHPGCRAFFLDLATNPKTRGLVHVSALAAGPSLAAINLALEHRGRYSLFLVSYDRSFARLSPGVIHLNRLMQRAIGRGLAEFDFLVGEQRLKREWADELVALHDHIAAATLRGHLGALPARALAHAKRVVKQTPALWSAFQRVRTALGAWRRPHP